MELLSLRFHESGDAKVQLAAEPAERTEERVIMSSAAQHLCMAHSQHRLEQPNSIYLQSECLMFICFF